VTDLKNLGMMVTEHKTMFMKKIRDYLIWGMLETMQFRVIFLDIYYQKCKD
jgi:hypothetical protein